MKDIKSVSVSDEKAEKLIGLAVENGITVATAESCTGGLASARLTAIPGSSAVVLGGVVSYANSVKVGVLQVSEETLAQHGAVSLECAREMAQGLRSLCGCDIAVSVTGIAGPGGGSDEKPVGMICFGIACSAGADSHVVYFDRELPRDEIRLLASDHAIDMFIQAINGK